MIASFKHKGLKKFYETDKTVGIQNKHRQKLRIRLTALDTATCIKDLDLPGFRLHPLKGNRKGLWAVDVSENWRVVFKFEESNAYLIDYEDYH